MVEPLLSHDRSRWYWQIEKQKIDVYLKNYKTPVINNILCLCCIMLLHELRLLVLKLLTQSVLLLILRYWYHINFFTPRVSDGCNGFVCVCMWVCVCLALTAEQTDIQTWILACRSSGIISRSSSKVIGQGHQVKKNLPKFRDMPASTGPEEATQGYDCKVDDAGCTQSICGFFFL